MRLQDIQVGKYYRLNNTGGQFTQYYGWVKVLEIYKKGQWNSPDKTKSIVKCEHTIDKTSTVGFIRHFRPMDLVDTNEK
jgi:hypothetical protein